jgi:hypothetical protein
MPCLLTLLALVTPRLVIILLWLFTKWFSGLFANIMWPILGFIFLPTTLLWYSAVQRWFDGQWGLWAVIGLIIALVIDLSPAKRRRRAR